MPRDAAALPISVLLLARDEARRLEWLLPTLDFARDVVVVVDAATTDGTRDVATRHGARVFERALDGFGPQRRFALAQCREPWVLWLDADERLPEGAAAAFARVVTADVTTGAGAERSGPARAATGGGAPMDGFRLGRRTWFLGAPIRWCGWRRETVLRLFRRERARFDDAPVHERVEVSGRVGDLPVTLEHRSYESWDECRRKLLAYAPANAERARRAGRRAGPADVLLRPPLRFLRMYVLQLGVLDGARGVAVCGLAAAQVFLKYADLWASRVAPPGEPPA